MPMSLERQNLARGRRYNAPPEKSSQERVDEMDLMTLQRKNLSMGSRYGMGVTVGGGNASEEKEDRINDLVKRTNSSKPTTNRWGGKDYPIDLSDYGQWMSTLQTLSWVLRDCGYEIHYLTRNGLHFTNTDYCSYPALFDTKQSKVIALVATGKDGRHFRFSHDGDGLRVRKFDNITRAIAPMAASADPNSKPCSASMVKEIVRVMKSQSLLDPKDPQSLRKWGRVVQNKALKPCGAGVLKGLLNLQFRKMGP